MSVLTKYYELSQEHEFSSYHLILHFNKRSEINLIKTPSKYPENFSENWSPPSAVWYRFIRTIMPNIGLAFWLRKHYSQFSWASRLLRFIKYCCSCGNEILIGIYNSNYFADFTHNSLVGMIQNRRIFTQRTVGRCIKLSTGLYDCIESNRTRCTHMHCMSIFMGWEYNTRVLLDSQWHWTIGTHMCWCVKGTDNPTAVNQQIFCSNPVLRPIRHN